MKKCINCGKDLPENASFCPYCTTSQIQTAQPKPLRLWRKKAICALAVFLVILLCAGMAAYLARPKTYVGETQLTYTTPLASYDVQLAFAGPDEGERALPATERSISITPNETWISFSHLCVYDHNGDHTLIKEFAEQIDSIKITQQPLDGKMPLELFLPESMEEWPFALYSARFAFSTECSKTKLIWNLYMKNGDTLQLSHDVIIYEKQG